MTNFISICTNFMRKTLMASLNALKFLLVFGSIPTFLFFACGVDSEGKAGDICMLGMFISIAAMFVGILFEIIVVVFLLKPNERLTTIFDFKIYSKKHVNPMCDFAYGDEDDDEEYETVTTVNYDEYKFEHEDSDYEYYVRAN